jgi:hypothetical protein
VACSACEAGLERYWALKSRVYEIKSIVGHDAARERPAFCRQESVVARGAVGEH